jgi:tripartite-type tricarboxylate transporter receptor subunit TctC
MKAVALAVAGMLGISACLDAGAQSYPSKAIRIIVPFAPGGATDMLARTIAQKFNEAWGQPVVVDNRPGAAGNIGTEMVARSQPDGYTLLMTINTHALNASLFSKLPYDPIKDFQPLTLVATAPNVLVVHPSLPPNSVQELIRLAKSKPNELTYGSAGSGSGSQLAGVLFANMAGVKLIHVPYKGITPAVVDLMGGQISMCFSVLSVAYPHMQAGKLKAIAVTTAKRSARVPNLPTVAEGGLKGYDVFSWFGLLLPANTPKEIVAKLHAEVVRAISLPDVKEKVSSQGVDLVSDSPEQFGEFIKQDWAVWDKVIKSIGMKLD